LVAPADGEYSPPESEVGMLIMGILEGLGFGGLEALPADRDSSSSGVETEFATAYVRIINIIVSCIVYLERRDYYIRRP
jgi:hypothetical protein